MLIVNFLIGWRAHLKSVLIALFLAMYNLSVFAEPSEEPKRQPTQSAWSKVCVDWDDWDKPGPPFRVCGNTYYVGTCGIASILIAGETGHVLIDGGTQAGASLIADNIEALGFSVGDIQVLLHNHEHFDHVAGLAELQQRSKAKLLASR